MTASTQTADTFTMPEGPLIGLTPHNAGYGVMVSLRDAIAAVQDAGYLVYEKSELPELVETPQNEGQPNLPPGYSAHTGGPKSQNFYREAFGKLALAIWWEGREAMEAKRRGDLMRDIFEATDFGPSMVRKVANDLLERGWRK